MVVVAGAVLAPVGPVHATLDRVWPSPRETAAIEGIPVELDSGSPFAFSHVGREGVRETAAQGTLFLPREAGDAPVPGVILLHGASGVSGAREMAYGKQFAAMGIAALVLDVFGARRDFAQGFTERLIEITEAMMLADAFAGLRYLAARPEIDAARVALIGFSYGGMATTYAAHEQVSGKYAPEGLRFAAHVAYYAPCIVRFADRRATGAPVLFLAGGRDAIVDPARCAEVDSDLRAGGARVERIVYPEGLHQWDGRFAGVRTIGRNLAPCRFRVERDGSVTDLQTGLPMSNRWFRIAALVLCADREGYLIGRDDEVRAQSNRDVARFLNGVFFTEDGGEDQAARRQAGGATKRVR